MRYYPVPNISFWFCRHGKESCVRFYPDCHKIQSRSQVFRLIWRDQVVWKPVQHAHQSERNGKRVHSTQVYRIRIQTNILYTHVLYPITEWLFHRPLLTKEILPDILGQSKSSRSELSFIPDRNTPDQTSSHHKVIIFVVGGFTYEESRAVSVANRKNGCHVVLGGTSLLTFDSYMEEMKKGSLNRWWWWRVFASLLLE